MVTDDIPANLAPPNRADPQYLTAIGFRCAHQHRPCFAHRGAGGVEKDTPIAFLGKLFALLGQSAPLYPIGLILMWVFANQIAPHDHRVGNLDDIKLPPWWIGESTVERRW